MIKTRNGQTIVTNEGQNKLLKKLYGSAGGRILLKGLTAPTLSRTVGKFMDSRYSKPLIKPFIKKSGIELNRFFNVSVGIATKEKDLGDCSAEEVVEVYTHLVPITEFIFNTISKLK